MYVLCKYIHIHGVIVLVESGADIYIPDIYNKCPLDFQYSELQQLKNLIYGIHVSICDGCIYDVCISVCVYI